MNHIKKITNLVILIMFFSIIPCNATSIAFSIQNENNQSNRYAQIGSLSVSKLNTCPWTNCVIDVGGNVGKESSIAVDSRGNLHICYVDEDNLKLKYAHWTGAEWKIETIDPRAQVSSFSNQVSIAVDKNDNPHILYRDEWLINEPVGFSGIKYAVHMDGRWSIQYIVKDYYDGQDFRCLYYIKSSRALTLDTEDNPHIVFRLQKNEINKQYWSETVKYAYRKDGKWMIYDVDSVKNSNIGWSLNLALDTRDRPHICYTWYKGEKKACIKYAFYDERWDIKIVKSGDIGNPAIAVDLNGNPHVTFLNWTSGTLIYAFYDGKWSFQSLSSSQRGIKNPIVIDQKNNPHICHVINQRIEHIYYKDGWFKETVNECGEDDTWLSVTLSDLAIDKKGDLHLTYWLQKYHDLEYSTTMNITSPPDKPKPPDGSASVKKRIPQKYIFSAADPDKDNLFFYIDWGDGKMDLKGPYSSGIEVEITHIWNNEGSYRIRYKAVDTFGAYSPWSDPLSIVVSKGKHSISFIPPIEKPVHRFFLLRSYFTVLYIFHLLL